MSKVNNIHRCIDYLIEHNYYGDFNMLFAANCKDTADYICEVFTTQNGDEVSDKIYKTVKEMLEG